MVGWLENGVLKTEELGYNATVILPATHDTASAVLAAPIPDGYKDVPADRLTPRLRLKKSLDELLSVKYDKKKVIVAVESKVFGIGVENYTVGSM